MYVCICIWCFKIWWWFLLHQVIFHLKFKKLSYHFRKVKPDDKARNWLTLSYCACQRPSSWERLWRDFFGLLPTESHIAFTLSGHLEIKLPAGSGIFCPFLEAVYWPCGLKFVYPIINLAFLWIINKVKLPAKFCLHSFEWICFQINSDGKYFFFSCPKNCDQGLIVVIVYYFQIWLSRVISSHMGPMYIETPYIYMCMCLYVYICACFYIYVYVFIYFCAGMSLSLSLSLYIYIYMHIYIYLCV